MVTNTFSQSNLVPNSGFETYSACPTGGGQLPLAAPWYAPTNNDAELYNVCSGSMVGVPVNNGGFSFQYPVNGLGYAGIFSYNWYGLNYREYLQVQLDTTLQPNTCYLVSYFANLRNGERYAINNLGLYFSDTSITTTGTGLVLNLIPQILKYKNPIINDTVNWIQINGIYIANGGEKYLTIGNFMDDNNTDTLVTNIGAYPGAYYFIDDVSVIALDSSKGSAFSFWEYNDTSVYAGDSVFIGNEITGLNCIWYDSLGNMLADSVPGIYVSPTTATNYIVVENLCGTIRIDTITVTVNYVGIEEPFGSAQGDKIVVYPNPASGAFTIRGFEKNVSYATIRLTDLQGQEIFNGEVVVKNGMGQLDPERSGDVANGTYLLYIRMEGTNERTVKRVVVQE